MAANRHISMHPVAAFKNEHFTLTAGKVHLEQVLGKGAFSTVYRAKYEGATVAVKKQTVGNPDLERYLLKELAILRRCNHPNLVHYVGACRLDADTVYIATEYCQGGHLRRLLQREEALGWKLRSTLLLGVAEAIMYLHDRQVIHRDIKTENVLLDLELTPKVCDFGFARDHDANAKTPGGRPMTMCGTDEFMAPEMIFGMEYNEKADIFGFGIVLAEVISRKIPGKKDGFLQRHARNGFNVEKETLAKLGEDFAPPQSLLLLCEETLAEDAEARPNAEACFHWLEDLVKDMPPDVDPAPKLMEAEVLRAVEVDLEKQEEEEEEYHSGFGGFNEEAAQAGDGIEGLRAAYMASLTEELKQATVLAREEELRAQEFGEADDDDDDDDYDDDGDDEEEDTDDQYGEYAAKQSAAPPPKAAGSRRTGGSVAKTKSKPASSGASGASGAAAPRAVTATAMAKPKSKPKPQPAAASRSDGKPRERGKGKPKSRTKGKGKGKGVAPHIMSGYITKRGGRIKTWRKRFMVATSEGLVYFKNKEDFYHDPPIIQGTLMYCDMVVAPSRTNVADPVSILTAGRAHTFRVMTTARPRYFTTTDAKITSKWIRNINLAYSSWLLYRKPKAKRGPAPA